jgi:hypothetical protein
MSKRRTRTLRKMDHDSQMEVGHRRITQLA